MRIKGSWWFPTRLSSQIIAAFRWRALRCDARCAWWCGPLVCTLVSSVRVPVVRVVSRLPQVVVVLLYFVRFTLSGGRLHRSRDLSDFVSSSVIAVAFCLLRILCVFYAKRRRCHGFLGSLKYDIDHFACFWCVFPSLASSPSVALCFFRRSDVVDQWSRECIASSSYMSHEGWFLSSGWYRPTSRF